jgi:hypothetical protein
VEFRGRKRRRKQTDNLKESGEKVNVKECEPRNLKKEEEEERRRGRKKSRKKSSTEVGITTAFCSCSRLLEQCSAGVERPRETRVSKKNRESVGMENEFF